MLLIEGKAHAYVFPSPGCKKWDTCAPEAVLHAMGGKLTDIHGNLYDYHKDVGMRWVRGLPLRSSSLRQRDLPQKNARDSVL